MGFYSLIVNVQQDVSIFINFYTAESLTGTSIKNVAQYSGQWWKPKRYQFTSLKPKKKQEKEIHEKTVYKYYYLTPVIKPIKRKRV